MKQVTFQVSSADVLNAFAIEPEHDRSTLERYLRNYPQYAVELAGLSFELSRANNMDAGLSEKDKLAIDDAWKQFLTVSTGSPVNIFTSLSVPQLRELAKLLGVPRQVITALSTKKTRLASGG